MEKFTSPLKGTANEGKTATPTNKQSVILAIAAYCRISVDEEIDSENTSIENQKSIIADYAARVFPNAQLDFYEDRDRSGYTFEQREGYMRLRPLLLNGTYSLLIVKDFSRFSRRNSKGLVELEDLRDAGLRIISIGDGIDYPTHDDWTAIQFRFLINEMPVTDTSKKVKSVVARRQAEGKWVCSVPYGYVMTNTKAMTFEIDEGAAEVVREIYRLYNNGWGYKKIANHLTDMHIPTPRTAEFMRRESDPFTGVNLSRAKSAWSIITIQHILENDFYIGTLRQGKYKRKRINGSDVKTDTADHIVFENNHTPIIDYKTFAIAAEQRKKRSTGSGSNYRGLKKYSNFYSGVLFCGDCGAPMFSRSNPKVPAYICSSYHKRGLKGCTSHHTKVELLDRLLKSYVRKVRDNSQDMIAKLDEALRDEKELSKGNTDTIAVLQRHVTDCKAEMKALMHQKARELMRDPAQADILDEMYSEMIDELAGRIDGLQNQIELVANRHSNAVRANRVAKTAVEVFDKVLNKEKLDKCDIELIIERITVYESRIDIQLKADLSHVLQHGGVDELVVTQESAKRKSKAFSVEAVSEGENVESAAELPELDSYCYWLGKLGERL